MQVVKQLGYGKLVTCYSFFVLVIKIVTCSNITVVTTVLLEQAYSTLLYA
jgi:hypothetical protein